MSNVTLTKLSDLQIRQCTIYNGDRIRLVNGWLDGSRRYFRDTLVLPLKQTQLQPLD